MGKLNILHHKTWHVYSKANREIVERDERQAQQERQVRTERNERNEREYRQQRLRQKPHQTLLQTDGNIDLFSDLIEKEREETIKAAATNPEFMKEKQIKEDKWDEQITTYLTGRKRGKDLNPWYSRDGTSKYTNEKKKQVDDEVRKEKLDPMRNLIRKEDFQSYATEIKPSSGKKSIEEMRRERLQREKREKERARALVGEEKQVYSKEERIVTGRYHAAFHPEVKRKRQKPY